MVEQTAKQTFSVRYEKERPERRTKLTIFSDILRLLQRNNGSAKPTHILYGANLSHKRMKQYLEEMLASNFIERVDAKGKTVYKITKRGQEFLMQAKKIKQFSEAFGIEL